MKNISKLLLTTLILSGCVEPLSEKDRALRIDAINKTTKAINQDKEIYSGELTRVCTAHLEQITYDDSKVTAPPLSKVEVPRGINYVITRSTEIYTNKFTVLNLFEKSCTLFEIADAKVIDKKYILAPHKTTLDSLRLSGYKLSKYTPKSALALAGQASLRSLIPGPFYVNDVGTLIATKGRTKLKLIMRSVKRKSDHGQISVHTYIIKTR